MVHNPITEEIRDIRHRLAAQSDNDVSRIGDETRRRQAASGRRVVRLPSRTPIAIIAPSHPIHQTGEVGRIAVEQLSPPPGDR